MIMMKKIQAACAMSALCLSVGCGETFDPFEKVQGLRVLGVSADKPALLPGEDTVLDALLHQDPDVEVKWQWDWCPFPSGPQDEYECGISQEEFDAQLTGFGIEAPALDLGSAPTASFTYPLSPEVLQGLCAALTEGQDIPDFVVLPDCSESFPITVRLIVEQEGVGRIVAIKSIRLLYDAPTDEEVNSNPRVGGVKLARPGVTEEDAAELVEGEAYVVAREEEVKLTLEVAPEMSQTYTPPPSDRDPNPVARLENLRALWFYEDGELEFESTGFIDGFLSLEELSKNTLTLPDAESYPDDEMNIYVVIQDDRGGMSWVKRSVKFE